MRKCSVIFAGGKTGGHLFPGVAVALDLQKKYGGKLEIVFAGLKEGLEERVIPEYGWKLEFIPMTTPRSGGVKGIVRFFLYSFPVSFIKSFLIIARYRPASVISLGGYSGFPVAVAAWFALIPVYVLEQNTYMGVTNRIISLFARKIFLPFESDKLKGGKYIVTGNPVRELKIKKSEHDRFIIGILGGSQGARGLNDLIFKTLPHLTELKDKVKFIHQVGRLDKSEIEENYRKYGFEAEVLDFIKDMGKFYSDVDLLISRAGATTIAELVSIGKGAIFVPFPHAADDHQTKNARYLEEKGAGVLFPESEDSQKLAEIVRDYFFHRGRLEQINKNMASLYKSDAKKIIVEEIGKELDRLCLEG